MRSSILPVVVLMASCLQGWAADPADQTADIMAAIQRVNAAMQTPAAAQFRQEIVQAHDLSMTAELAQWQERARRAAGTYVAVVTAADTRLTIQPGATFLVTLTAGPGTTLGHLVMGSQQFELASGQIDGFGLLDGRHAITGSIAVGATGDGVQLVLNDPQQFSSHLVACRLQRQ